MSYRSKQPTVLGRQLKVQKLSIPFTIVGSATAANVTISCDEPAVMFIKTEGNDQITAALASGETITYVSTPTDSTGIFTVLIKTGETVSKLVSARCKRYHSTVASSTEQLVGPGDADGLTSAGNIALNVDSDIALNAANTLACTMEVEYVVSE